jgi:hypothetical protein
MPGPIVWVATLESVWQTSVIASRWAQLNMPMAPAAGLGGNPVRSEDS